MTGLNMTMLVKDRPEHTMQSLDTLHAYTTVSYNLTIVDDASEEETKRALQLWVDRHNNKKNIHLVRNDENRGVGASRNQAIVESEKTFGRGRMLYISDNDVCFTRNWIDIMLLCWRRAKTKKFKILGGYNHPFLQPNRTYNVMGGISIHACDAVGTPSWLLEWETWDRFGPFDSHAKGVRQSEDWKFCQDVIKAGYKVGYVDPHVVHNTGVTDTFGEKIPGYELVPEIEGVMVK